MERLCHGPFFVSLKVSMPRLKAAAESSRDVRSSCDEAAIDQKSRRGGAATRQSHCQATKTTWSRDEAVQFEPHPLSRDGCTSCCEAVLPLRHC